MMKETRNEKTVSVARGGILAALMMVLSFFENSFPIPFLPVGVKLGSANIAVISSLFLVGNKCGFTLAVLKGLFSLLLRGPVSGALSLSGGILSIISVMALKKVKGLSVVFISIAGAVFHNIGQLVCAFFIIDNPYLLGYLPVLIAAGIIMGSITGFALKVIMPYLSKALRHFK